MRLLVKIVVVGVSVMAGLAAVGTSAATAGGLSYEILRHEVEATVTAQLFDGGPPVTGGASQDNPNDFGVVLGASDSTGVGAWNSTVGGGVSSISNFELDAGLLRIFQNLDGRYSGSGLVLPGGTMSGEMTSIIEFAMPVESLEWDLVFIVDETPSFDLSALLTIENVTSGEMLVSVSETFGFIDTLEGNVGDVIRVTTEYEVSGGVEAGASGFFSSKASLRTDFVIPEPTTATLFMTGAGLFFMARKRSGR
jgi:hypothetical protein